MKTVPLSRKIVISCPIKRDISFPVWKKSMKTDTIQWSESNCKIKTRVKFQGGRAAKVTFRDPSRKVNHQSKVFGYRKIIAEFARSISSTRISEPVLMVYAKVSKDKYINKPIDWDNFIYVRSIKNRAQK